MDYANCNLGNTVVKLFFDIDDVGCNIVESDYANEQNSHNYEIADSINDLSKNYSLCLWFGFFLDCHTVP